MKTLLLSFFSLLAVTGSAQKYDYRWMIGYVGTVPDSNTTLWAVNNLDFRKDTLEVYREFRYMSLITSGIAANDKDGELLFYTDGLKIHNHNDQLMQNGNGLNPGKIADQWQNLNIGYPDSRGCAFLPLPGSNSIYYLFHSGTQYDTIGNMGTFFSRSYYSVIDMTMNGGLGAVTDKNHVIIIDTINGGGGRAFCKHANGRDWWMVVQEVMNNCFYKFLLTPNGIDSIGKQCIGDTVHVNTDRGTGCFSPNGNIYVWSNPYEGLNILDFDRCTGEFDNHRRIAVTDSLTAATGSLFVDGVSISGNSRYLYLSTGTEVRQFDLQAPDIALSEVIVENSHNGLPLSAVMYGQLAPDGKIYINVLGPDTFMHVIHHPDSAGLACGFERNAVELPCWNVRTMPYYPNYRLGRLIGSSCDTVDYSSTTDIAAQEKMLSVQPNPAGNYVVVDYGFLDWSKGSNAQLQIHNNTGQLVYTQNLPMYSGYQKLDVSSYAKGLYLISLHQNGQKVEEVKILKE